MESLNEDGGKVGHGQEARAGSGRSQGTQEGAG